MATNKPPAKTPATESSYGVRELKQAQRAGSADESIEIDIAAPKPSEEARGFDPYNSSGSFDRRKNWERVRKR